MAGCKKFWVVSDGFGWFRVVSDGFGWFAVLVVTIFFQHLYSQVSLTLFINRMFTSYSNVCY